MCRLDPSQVERAGDGYVLRGHPGVQVVSRAHKMSKSRGNVVNPDDIVHSYGADSLRLYEMFMGPLRETKVRAWCQHKPQAACRHIPNACSLRPAILRAYGMCKGWLVARLGFIPVIWYHTQQPCKQAVHQSLHAQC